MKTIKAAILLPFVVLSMGAAHAKGEIFYNVPFHDVEVKPASKIYVDYNFSPHTQVLVCKSNPADDAITSVEWTYKDVTRKIGLPIKLKDDMRVPDGHYADPHGMLAITNEFGSSSNTGSVLVSCEYQKIS